MIAPTQMRPSLSGLAKRSMSSGFWVIRSLLMWLRASPFSGPQSAIWSMRQNRTSPISASLGWVEDTCKKWSQGLLEGERLWVEWFRRGVHVERVSAEAQDMAAYVGAEAGNQGWCDLLPVGGHFG